MRPTLHRKSTRYFSTKKYLVLLLAVAVAVGCSSKEYVRQYQSGVAENRARLASLRVGMSRAEAEAAMGRGTTVSRKRIQLRNPYRSETMKLSDSRSVEVLYYVTDGRIWEDPETQTLTPLLFENGRLVGWGWAFLTPDKPKYVSGPP